MNKNLGILILLPAERGLNTFQYAKLLSSVNSQLDYLPFDFHGSGEYTGSEFNAVGFLSVEVMGNNQMVSNIDKYLEEICNSYKDFANISELYLGEGVKVKILHHDRLIKLPTFGFGSSKPKMKRGNNND